MNIKTMLLKGELEEDIYIEQIEGFIVSRQEQKLCGVKQVRKQWHEKFDKIMQLIVYKLMSVSNVFTLKAHLILM